MNGMENDARFNESNELQQVAGDNTVESSESDGASAKTVAVVLGPVAAKGPKRFGAMPDLSKIPAGARERLAQFALDGPAWGTSSSDARSLATTSNPEDLSLDLSPLGVPTPHSQPVSTTANELPSSPISDSAQELDEDEFDPEFGSFNEATFGESVDSGPLFEAGSSSLVSAGSAAESGPVVSISDESPVALDSSESPLAPAASGVGMAVNPTTGSTIGDDTSTSEPAWYDDVPIPEEPVHSWDVEPEGDPFAHVRMDHESVNSQIADSNRGNAVHSPLPPTNALPQLDGTIEPALDEASVRAEAEAHLRTLVGSDKASLREDQWHAIKALVVDNARALVVQRTGWGKSAVYFVATALLRARGNGPTIIVSPLLALMRDQISAAERAGIKAATINSANVTEWDEIQAKIRSGDVDVLLCSPERLNNPGFRDDVLPRLAQDAGLVVVDEAHCISDWGHDFRPDYRRIRTLLQELRPGIPVLATTATANERVSADIAEQLSVTTDGSLENVVVLRGALDRESLHLAVIHLNDMAARVAWIVDALRNLPGSGIVYCMTVSAAQEVTEQLNSAGLNVAAYTGRTDPDERAELELQLKNNQVKALIATSALGMGFDKPDLTFVIHLGAPNSPIAYYQQVGRAGRGVAQASSVLLPGKEDREIWEYFGSLAFPKESQVREVLSLLDAAASNGMGPISIPQLESKVDLKRSRLEVMLKVLDVDGAVKRVQGGWISTGQQWAYDTERYQRVEAARLAEQNAMLKYSATTKCRIGFLRAALDDPDLAPDFQCGRCDNCGGISLPSVVSSDALAVTNASKAKPGIAVPPRKMWPANMAALGLELSGRLKPDELAEEGRAIARIDGLGWSNELRELFSSRTVDGPTPLNLRTAAVEVLAAWPEISSIEGIMSVRSASRPELVQHLAQGLAQYLGRPFVGSIGPRGDSPTGRHDVNSAMRLAGVAKRLQLELSPGAEQGLPGRSILLVDDYTESGWTLAVATRLLKQAGAAKVYPFVLSQN